LAEVIGDATPDGFPHLRRRALWDPDAVCDARRRALLPQLGALDAVLGLDDTGFLQQGRHAAGVARHARGTAGTVEHGPIGVGVAEASRRGQAVLDRALYLPTAWTTAPARGRPAGMPADRQCVTTPPLARQRLARAFAAGGPARGGTGDRVYGENRDLRRWLEAQPQAEVLAVSGQA